MVKTPAPTINAHALKATHPLYDMYQARWRMYLDLYEGENLGLYIRRHARESLQSHARRAEIVAYRNFTAPVIDLYVHYIFSKKIERIAGTQANTGQRGKVRSLKPGIESEWEQWQKNVDRQRNTIDRYMGDLARWTLVFGHMGVLIDVPKVEREPKNETERKALGLSPYLIPYSPLDITNWELDEKGKLLWIRFREPLSQQIDPFSLRDRRAAQSLTRPTQQRWTQPYYTYRTWSRSEWWVHEVEGDRVTEREYGTHPVEEVPFVWCYNRRLMRYPVLGRSLVSDIALLNQEILNMDSLISESVYQSVLNILVLGRQPEEEEELVIGTNNVLTYVGDRPPYYLSPSTAPLDFMEDRVAKMRDEIYRLAKLGGGLGLEPRSSQSGVALAFEFNESNRTLAECADEFELVENDIHRVWHAWMGIPWRGAVNYPDEFSIQSFQEELQLLTSAKQVMRSPTVTRMLEKRVSRKLLPGMSEEDFAKIEKEIDFIPDMVSTFTGPVFYDALSQQTNPAGGGQPVGALAEILEFVRGQKGPETPPPEPEPEQEEAA